MGGDGQQGGNNLRRERFEDTDHCEIVDHPREKRIYKPRKCSRIAGQYCGSTCKFLILNLK